jgi:hypothetical protein
MKQSSMVVLASLILAGASHMMAQEPSAYLRIVQEDIKEGKSAAHVKSEMAFARAFAKTAFPNYVAWDAETGPSQVWFLERYDSYEAIERATSITAAEPLRTNLDQLEEVDGTLRTGSRTIIARYQKDLSYTPVGGFRGTAQNQQ